MSQESQKIENNSFSTSASPSTGNISPVDGNNYFENFFRGFVGSDLDDTPINFNVFSNQKNEQIYSFSYSGESNIDSYPSKIWDT